MITHSSRAPIAVPDPVTQMPLSMPTSCDRCCEPYRVSLVKISRVAVDRLSV